MTKIKSFSDLESLEFSILKEIPEDLESVKIPSKILSIDSDVSEIFSFSEFGKIVLHLKEEGILVIKSEDTYYTMNEDEIKVDWKINEIVLVNINYGLFFLDENVFDNKFIKGLMKKIIDADKTERSYYNYKLNTTDLELNKKRYSREEITELIDKAIIEKKEEQKEKQKIIEEREKQEEKEKELEQKPLREIYEQTGIFKYDIGDSIEVKGNNLNFRSNFDHFRFVLNKDVNKILSFDKILSLDSAGIYNRFDMIMNLLQEKKETFCLNNKLNFSFDTKGNFQIEGIKVKKSKLKILINTISGLMYWNKNLTKEDIKRKIKLLNDLNGMKMNFVELTEISSAKEFGGDELNISLKVECIDDMNFKVEFLGKEKVFDWNKVKDFFFSGGTSRSIWSYGFSYKDKFMRFVNEFGITKTELFDNIKKLKILKSLETQKNENN